MASPRQVDREACDWLSEALAEVFTSGLRVDFVEYSTPDSTEHMVIQCHQHEEEQNKYDPPSFLRRVSIVLEVQKSVPGGAWDGTEKALVSILGERKRSTVRRWICLARDVAQEVVAHATARKLRTLGWFVGNKYIAGRGDEARYKLSLDFATSALDLAADALAMGKGVTGDGFASEYCMPMWKLEQLRRKGLKAYGATASKFPAFNRLWKMFQSESGRMKILLCVKDGMPLEGRVGVDEKVEVAGIPEIRMVFSEMEKTKAGKIPPAKASVDGPAAEASEQGEAEGTAGEPRTSDAGPAGAPLDDDVDLFELADREGQKATDPVLAKAQELALCERARISVHKDRKAFVEDVRTRVLETHRCILWIDAPTSKMQVFHDYFSLLPQLPRASVILVPVGMRYIAEGGAGTMVG